MITESEPIEWVNGYGKSQWQPALSDGSKAWREFSLFGYRVAWGSSGWDERVKAERAPIVFRWKWQARRFARLRARVERHEELSKIERRHVDE